MTNLNSHVRASYPRGSARPPMRDLHPIHEWEAGIFNGFSCKVDLNNPSPEMLNLFDIATALSKICRFNGHLSEFYSVAQHSVLVSYLVPNELRKAALLHDAPEAYLGDVIKPLKNIIGEVYYTLEKKFEDAICRKFGIDTEHMARVKYYDKRAVELEFSYFFKGEDPITRIFGPEPCWDHQTAKEMFLSTLREVDHG